MSVNEWTANLGEKLAIPAERRATQRYRWQAPAPISLLGTCAEYVVIDRALCLRDVLIDTSQRAHGTVLEPRVTHRRELVIANAPVVLFPLNDDEGGHGA